MKNGLEKVDTTIHEVIQKYNIKNALQYQKTSFKVFIILYCHKSHGKI